MWFYVWALISFSKYRLWNWIEIAFLKTGKQPNSSLLPFYIIILFLPLNSFVFILSIFTFYFILIFTWTNFILFYIVYYILSTIISNLSLSFFITGCTKSITKSFDWIECIVVCKEFANFVAVHLTNQFVI